MGGLIPAGTTWDDEPEQACDIGERFMCVHVLAGYSSYLESKHLLGADERLHVVACTGEGIRERGGWARDVELMVRLLEHAGDEARGARRWIHRLIWGEG